MRSSAESGSPAPVGPDILVRILRHEVGGLLQTVYSCVAILQQRLPATSELERNALTTLRGQAEACKNLLDAVHDYLLPPKLSFARVNLTDLAGTLVAKVAPRFAHLQVTATGGEPVIISADSQALTQLGNFLLAKACNTAREKVEFQTLLGPVAGEAEWVISNDGTAIPAEEVESLLHTMAFAHDGRLVLGLAPAEQIIRRHGGRLDLVNRERGWAMRVILPKTPPEAEKAAP
jgi:nitrogen fixation/metabolism regulation signal transduction histidine kinase